MEKIRRLTKWIAAINLGICIIIAILYGVFQLSKARDFQIFGKLVSHIETNEMIVALTFDDAPTPRTSEVMDILESKNVPATFYMIGSAIEQHPDIAKTIVDRGYEIGNHSYSHERFYFKSQSFIENEVETTNTLIRNTGYTGQITFRPPNGKKLIGLPWYLSQHNITTIMWDVEPDTYYPNNAEGMISYTLQKTHPGSIILLHPFCNDECSADREALPQIIDGLKAKGYRFVLISELLQAQK
jgi:chitin deacetylase